jgi:hypothetical protein
MKKRAKKRSVASIDFTMFEEAIFSKEKKKEKINADFLIEELKKRRPHIPVVKKIITPPESHPERPQHTPLYPRLSQEEKDNYYSKFSSRTDDHDPQLSTRAITSRSTLEDTKTFYVVCVCSPNVVPYQMKQSTIPKIRKSRGKTSISNVPRKSRSLHTRNSSGTTTMYSWKYCGEANDTLGVYTARLPLKSDPQRIAEAQSRIDTVRKVKVEKRKKKAVKPRDLFAMSIQTKDNYNIDYDNDIPEEALANDDVQTFLVCEDKTIPLKVSILK